MSKRELLLATIRTAVSDIFFYGRQNDDELNRGDVKELLESGEVTTPEICCIFEDEVKQRLSENFEMPT